MTILASFDMFIVRIEFDSAIHSAHSHCLGFGLDAPELLGFLGVYSVVSTFVIEILHNSHSHFSMSRGK